MKTFFVVKRIRTLRLEMRIFEHKKNLRKKIKIQDFEVEVTKKDEKNNGKKKDDNKQKIISLEMSTHYITRHEAQARI